MLAEPLPAPELGTGHVVTVGQATLRELFSVWGLDEEGAGTKRWNPLGALIPPNARVVLKPNWVLHYNQGGAGLDCLLTHPSVIAAVLDYVALAHPSEVVVGDAPVQGCDFPALLGWSQMESLARRFGAGGLPTRVTDFRQTVQHGRGYGSKRTENRRESADDVLFDLAGESLLEAISGDAQRFRVTRYSPDLLGRTHAPGRHQYLIAREVIQADVVINLPKLKSHKKACVTGALKNIVGICGKKEYLPHHRKGSAGMGGDCYPGSSWLKRRAEDLLDAANRRPADWMQRLLGRSAGEVARCARLLGADDNLEGSWYGNDTVWRTCLDLQRILRYGRLDGCLDPLPQRLVITITDAIIGGEGEGPLANTPIAAGFLTGSLSTAAADWVHARLMGFDPKLIPLVRESFAGFSHRLAAFRPAEIRVRMAGRELPAQEIWPFAGKRFRPPEGWRGHCELPAPEHA
ncbi:MAG: DUF362 domain-containing protein [Bryobacteraceae bacterium]|jgi:uncharacterized protein (DUF362 family)